MLALGVVQTERDTRDILLRLLCRLVNMITVIMKLLIMYRRHPWHHEPRRRHDQTITTVNKISMSDAKSFIISIHLNVSIIKTTMLV